MRPGVFALLALLAAAAPSRAEIVSLKTEAIRLEGPQPPLVGPRANEHFHFPRDGWVEGYGVDVLDAKGRRVDEKGVFCHAVIRRHGLNTPLIMAVAEGATSVRFPEGYGVAVDTVTRFDFQGVLQSPGHAADGMYSFETAIDFVPRGGPREIVTLTPIHFDASFSVTGNANSEEWEVPPGRHVYSSDFVVPDDAVAHALSFHLHRFVESVELLDAKSGAVLYRAALEKRSDGLPAPAPFYSSKTGIPLTGGAHYVFRISYDNPLAVPERTMGIIWLYVAPRGR